MHTSNVIFQAVFSLCFIWTKLTGENWRFSTLVLNMIVKRSSMFVRFQTLFTRKSAIWNWKITIKIWEVYSKIIIFLIMTNSPENVLILLTAISQKYKNKQFFCTNRRIWTWHKVVGKLRNNWEEIAFSGSRST